MLCTYVFMEDVMFDRIGCCSLTLLVVTEGSKIMDLSRRRRPVS